MGKFGRSNDSFRNPDIHYIRKESMAWPHHFVTHCKHVSYSLLSWL
jgi:hypothetical protein